MGIFLAVAEISNIILAIPNIPDILGVNSRCWVQAYVSQKKMRVNTSA